jgi:hypothetical protein
MEEPRPIRIDKAVSRAKKVTLATVRAAVAGLQALLIALGPVHIFAQNLPAPEDTRHSILREAMLGLLTAQASVPDNQLQQHCLALPAGAPDDRLQSPHGNSLISTNCEVVPDQPLDRLLSTGWLPSRYRWTSVFTAEDKGRGPDAQDTVTEEEVVLFEASAPDQVRAVLGHARFDTGPYAIWASVTPEVAQTSEGNTLLSVMSCVNGTGGCGQEFMQRHADGRWYPVHQDWLDQLPKGFLGRIRHGVRIDPRTLQGEAGFYGDRDPNCCPSQRLLVQLKLRGNSLVLVRHTLVREP